MYDENRKSAGYVTRAGDHISFQVFAQLDAQKQDSRVILGSAHIEQLVMMFLGNG